jgi:putative hemolysin
MLTEANLARVQEFSPRFEFSFEMGHYRVKTASSYREVLSSLRLRHEVFYEELRKETAPSGLDVDRFDSFFDHLIIVDMRKDMVIATYRLYSSLWGDDFYTKSEFEMPGLAKLQGPILEMGRACVHKDYRKGAVMTMLWRGIAEYLKVSGCRVLMGCGSIQTVDLQETAVLTKHFQQTQQLPEVPLCSPIGNYIMPGLDQTLAQMGPLSEEQTAAAEAQIPSLFRTYLKMGCIVGGLPALDTEFHCIDFVVLLEMEKLNSLYGKKYRVAEEAT